jgi:uncharacterized Zn finger protein
MANPQPVPAFCPECGKDMTETGVTSTVVGSGGSNVVLLSCTSCSKVFSAFPGPLQPRLAGR